MAGASKTGFKPDADYLNNVVEAITRGYAPESPEFHDFLGTPQKPKGFIDSLRINLLGMTEEEENAKQRRIFENQLGSAVAGKLLEAEAAQHIAKQFAPPIGQLPESVFGLAPLQPNQMRPPTSVEMQTGLAGLAPSPLELATLEKRAGEFDPNTGYLNPQARATLPQQQVFTSLAAGKLAPSATGDLVPPSLSGPVKPDIREVGGQLYRMTPQGATKIEGVTPPDKPADFGNDREAIADELYGKPFAKLDTSQKSKVNVRVKQDKVDVAGAGAGIRADIELKQPLPPQQANELGVPYGTTREEATGLPVLTPNQREALAGYDTSRTIIKDIKQYSEKVNKAQGGLVGRAKQAGALWGAYTQSDPDAALLMSKAGELASIARSLGEKGALANQDVARAAALVPGPLETATVAVKKIEDMETIINKGEANYRKSLGIGARQEVKAGLGSLSAGEVARATRLRASGLMKEEVEAILLRERKAKKK